MWISVHITVVFRVLYFTVTYGTNLFIIYFYHFSIYIICGIITIYNTKYILNADRKDTNHENIMKEKCVNQYRDCFYSY